MIMPAIEQVHEGMTVIDSNGDEVGKVRAIRMGDPEAASSDGQSMPRAPMEDFLTGIFGTSPDVSPEQAERLVRVGYVQIDRPLLGRDAFVASDRVERVDDDTVHLNIVVE